MKAYKRFLNYSYEPFRLHFCGPPDNQSEKLVDDYLTGKRISPKRLDKVICEFVGVYPYLELIARKNNLEPLDERVVEAYWLGNSLLKQVTISDLKRLIRENFIGEGKLNQQAGERLAENLPGRAVIHHSFHVFYIGSITNTVKLAGKLMDLCRVSWGKVESLSGQSIIISYRPMIIKPPKLRLSRDEMEKEIKWNQKILPKVRENQIVSFHWNMACEILSEDQARNLEKYTLRNIEAINSLRS